MSKRLTMEQAVIISAATGVLVAPTFAPVHEYIERLLGRPVYTHEMASELLWAAIKERAGDDLAAIAPLAPKEGK